LVTTSGGTVKVSGRGSGGNTTCTGGRDLEFTRVLGDGYHVGAAAGAAANVMSGAVADVGGISCGSSSRHVGCAGGGGGSSGVADSGSGGCSVGDSGGGGGGCCSGGGGGGGE